MEHDIEYVSDADYRNVMLDFSPLPAAAAFMEAVFIAPEQKPSTADLIRDLLD
ncbi:MAG: hypothetical protein ABJN62_14535 [Halioglobus sp.]